MNDTYRVVIDERIAQLWRDLHWYRHQPRPAHWFGLAMEARRELHVLLPLARKARRLAAAQPDPMDQYKSLAEWTEAELREAFA